VNELSLTPPMLQTPPPVFLKSKDKKNFFTDVKEYEIDMDEIDYDPEAVSSGVARRPMLLTHSFMIGLTVILLFVVIAIIVQEVSVGVLPWI
jgi:hypothetical protein